MAKRQIIMIDRAKCNGCGLCIPNCPEGALQIIDGKASLVSDLFCDGLGACIGHCPRGAITIEERQAQPYNEKKVMANIVPQGENVIKAHLAHLKEHNQHELLAQAEDYLEERGLVNHHKESPCGCPGLKVMDFRQAKDEARPAKEQKAYPPAESCLRQWPLQLGLVPPEAPYLQGADLLIAADCVPFAYAPFHQELLKGKILLAGCPKLDDLKLYQEKIGQIIQNCNIKSVTYAHMEVPCCFGLVDIIRQAISRTGRGIPFEEAVISIKGERIK